MMSNIMNVVKSYKRFDNLLKNILEIFENDDKRLRRINRERFCIVDRCKFAVINDCCKFCFMTDKDLNVIIIVRLNVMHVKFIII